MDSLKAAVSNLYMRTGQFNLYVCHVCKKNKPDTIRLKKEIEEIKRIIVSVEAEINKL